MRLFHRTRGDVAAVILRDGFKDAVDTYMTGNVYSGVWFSAQPLDSNEGVMGDTLLEIHMDDGIVEPYEWVEEGKPYREFLVPAVIANRYGPPRIVAEDEAQGLE